MGELLNFGKLIQQVALGETLTGLAFVWGRRPRLAEHRLGLMERHLAIVHSATRECRYSAACGTSMVCRRFAEKGRGSVPAPFGEVSKAEDAGTIR